MTATGRQRAALRAAVQPVYARLEGDLRLGRRLAAIEELKREAAPTVRAGPDCRRGTAARRPASRRSKDLGDDLEASRADRRGIDPSDAASLSGHHTAEFADGRFRFRGDPGSGKSAVGTYSVQGDVIRLVFETGAALQLGRPYELRWSVYRDALMFSAVPGSEPLLAFLTAPYTRVR